MANKNVKNQEAIDDKVATETGVTGSSAIQLKSDIQPEEAGPATQGEKELTLEELRAEAARIDELVKARREAARQDSQRRKQLKAQEKALRDANRKVKPVKTPLKKGSHYELYGVQNIPNRGGTVCHRSSSSACDLVPCAQAAGEVGVNVTS